MSEPLFAPPTSEALEHFISRPSHALLIVAPAGSGKATAARHIASKLLQVRPDKLDGSASFRHVGLGARKSISIDDIREIIHFTTLRMGGSDGRQRRVVLIEDAHTLTHQAQNALLKTLEEPPDGMTIILSSQSELSILPTIRSRAQQLTLQPPAPDAMTSYFTGQGYDTDAVGKALLMGGSLIGLVSALLAADSSHPLVAAATAARDILKKSAFERLLQVDSLSKQPELWRDMLVIMERMADIALGQGGATQKRWQAVLQACYDARAAAQKNAQAKLVILHFILAL